MSLDHSPIYNETLTPEYLAMRETLALTKAMQDLSVALLYMRPIKQEFLREALETLVDGYFSLEEKTMQCMRQNRNYATEIDGLRRLTEAQHARLVAMDAVINRFCTSGAQPPASS